MTPERRAHLLGEARKIPREERSDWAMRVVSELPECDRGIWFDLIAVFEERESQQIG